MSLRVITARLNGSTSDAAVLDGALSLAKPFGGHIDALFARPDPRMDFVAIDDAVHPGFHEEVVSVLERQWAHVANRALRTYDKWRLAKNVPTLSSPNGGDGPSIEWRDAVGTESETVGRKGALSDVFVTAMRPARANSRLDFSFEAALLETGRPVLLIPPNNELDPTHGRAVIAWNGSAEAFRAVTAALPILARGQDVLVFTAPEGNIDASIAIDLLHYLRWHGVKAALLKHESGRSNPVADALLDAVKKQTATLLVMGAYTHSRFKELLFGGVTRHVFAHAHTPVLMAH